MSSTRIGTVEETGAQAGDLLFGFNPLNDGLLIRVSRNQDNVGKRVDGSFELVNAGTGAYSEWLKEFEGQSVDARGLIEHIISTENLGKKNLHIFNRNQLKVFGTDGTTEWFSENRNDTSPGVNQRITKPTLGSFAKITKCISEANLESLILEDLNVVEEGLVLVKQQCDCPGIGRIDILCEDKDGNLVVIELKRLGAKSDFVLGQILRYIGYLENHLAKDGQIVRGIIIVGKIDEKLRYAASAVPNITLRTFNVTIE